MDSSEFSVLVGRLDRESTDHPRLHVAKVWLVTAMGYAPIALLAIIIVAALGVLVYSLVTTGRPSGLALVAAISSGIVLAAIVRALLVKIDLPAGREITREEAPGLFAALDDVMQRTVAKQRGKVRAAVIDTVTLDGSFDACVCQAPRWGIFGGYRNHLQIGVPLMTALSIAELKAQLARELGHAVSPRHAFAAWVYRQRLTWRALQEKFDAAANVFDRAIGTCYGRYAAYFHAYTLVLARSHEYAVDRLAAEATHPGALAHALTKIALMRRFLEEVFWPRFWEQIEKYAAPPYLPYSTMPRAFAIAQQQWARADWLANTLREFPVEGDTLPSLGERFAALRIEPALPVYAADRSSLSLFGADARAVLGWCDEAWREENASEWRKRHDAIRELRWKVAEYAKVPSSDLKPEDLWQKALLLLDLGDIDSAIEELRAVVMRVPSLAKAHFLLGKLRLEHGDEQGLQSLVLAATHDSSMIEEASGMGYGYLIHRGRKREAERFLERVRAA
jgi:hypothetical protein